MERGRKGEWRGEEKEKKKKMRRREKEKGEWKEVVGWREGGRRMKSGGRRLVGEKEEEKGEGKVGILLKGRIVLKKILNSGYKQQKWDVYIQSP